MQESMSLKYESLRRSPGVLSDLRVWGAARVWGALNPAQRLGVQNCAFNPREIVPYTIETLNLR